MNLSPRDPECLADQLRRRINLVVSGEEMAARKCNGKD